MFSYMDANNVCGYSQKKPFYPHGLNGVSYKNNP